MWLDPCGHLSAFEIARERYGGSYGLATLGSFDDLGEKSMVTKAKEVLSPGLKFTYEYDFGSTTALQLKVTGKREGRIGGGPLRLLARNDALAWTCRVCSEPATLVHTEELYGDENPFYCEQHAADDDYLYLPVVKLAADGRLRLHRTGELGRETVLNRSLPQCKIPLMPLREGGLSLQASEDFSFPFLLFSFLSRQTRPLPVLNRQPSWGRSSISPRLGRFQASRQPRGL